MPKILATNILDFVLQKRANILHLQPKQVGVYSQTDSKVATMTADVSPSAAVFVIDQQSLIIRELRHSLNESVKVAAALAEAAMQAKDGIIDSSDIIDYARRAMVEGTVKVSSLNDAFDQSPGQLQGNAVNQSGSSDALDPLTSALRSIGSPN